MDPKQIKFDSEFYTNSEILYDLTANKIRDILLVSSLYNFFSMEEGGILASRIQNEYKGLHLENPPRITGVSSTEEALLLLKRKEFDMVMIVPNLDNMDVFSLTTKIKAIHSNIPIILLSQNIREIHSLMENNPCEGIDNIFRWTGNPDLLLAIVKNAEDHFNVAHDTRRANLRVLILVEDSPEYYSHLLPIVYKEVVRQTQALLEVGLNEKQRSLTMRARPKILLAKTYEEAIKLYRKYRSFLLCMISDTRLPRDGTMDPEAGIHLLSLIKKENPYISLLLTSSESINRQKANAHAFTFIDKNSSRLAKTIKKYFIEQLGFGDFIFRLPDGQEIDRARNFMTLEEKLKTIPDESIVYHADRNHFSGWVMARCEIALATKFRSVSTSDFGGSDELREFIISNIHALRRYRQKGVVSKFDKYSYDPEVRKFGRIGSGSLGGKARGLAFMDDFFRQYVTLQKKHPEINIMIPRTMVICTDVFESFMKRNNLRKPVRQNLADERITEYFLNAEMPEMVTDSLRSYLERIDYPLSVRSSSQLEDAYYQPYAGLYRTYMIPNNHPDVSVRLEHLVTAIKLVYASTYFEDPKMFSLCTSNQQSKESMAVIIQEVSGNQYGDYYYPTVSGVAQSYNFYPFSHMKAEEGVASIALGLGKTVVDGEKCLRFSPKYPRSIPGFSTVDDILNNAQRSFFALKTRNYTGDLHFQRDRNLERLDVSDAADDFPVRSVAGTYVPDENRIRDTWYANGPKVPTFARLLKYRDPDLPRLLSDLLELGRKGFGCPVEIEFSVNLYLEKDRKTDFHFLQIRPMFTGEERYGVQIGKEEIRNAFCRSSRALGNGINKKMADIVYVKPESFKPEATCQIAEEINKINRRLLDNQRPYLLVGPGRWGSSDRWLGIPVKWRNISGVGAIIEIRNDNLNADSSQGSHFFHNITSLGIHYISVNEIHRNSSGEPEEFFDWEWIASLPAATETPFIRHVRLETPMMLKIDGKKSQCVIART